MLKKQTKDNSYLSYMDKAKVIEVEETKSPVAVFYCAGTSNLSQSTMLGSVKAANNIGYDKMPLLCLASISPGFANITNEIVAIDGCPIGCAKRTLNKEGFETDRYIIVSKELGLLKNLELNSSTVLKEISIAVENAVLEVYKKIL